MSPKLIGAATARRYRPHDQIRMTGNIFGQGDDRDVGAKGKRPIEARAAPGVVHSQERLTPRQALRQPRHILDVEDDRAGVVEIDHPGVWLEQPREVGASPVELAGDAALCKVVDGDGACRAIDRVRQ